jgi:uncharacterized repeat protein (TIGR03803 family)
MKRLKVSRRAVSVFAAVMLLPGCGGFQLNLPVSGTVPAREGGSNFVRLTSIEPPAAEKVLHSFGSGTDGAYPQSSLIDVKGTLYSTTEYGGAHGDGTVFSITSRGRVKVLHSFSGTDGGNPSSGLMDVHGVLYGTTFGYGAYGYGTVFSITTRGKEKVLYSFAGGPGDGVGPGGGLVYINGSLYGTTYFGGAYGYGTVFGLTTGGKENVLHSFGSGTDGVYPTDSLVNIKGTLYGTTVQGGNSYCRVGRGSYVGCGTVFRITTGGKEKVAYSFLGTDGESPQGVIDVKGKLYGTTETGGASGLGTVFSLTTGGKEKALHSFAGGPGDGANPVATVEDVAGILYGTTFNGGANGLGSVYTLTP